MKSTSPVSVFSLQGGSDFSYILELIGKARMLMMPWDHVAAPHEAFDKIDLDCLESTDDPVINALPYGIVGLSASGLTEIYNATEARNAGMQRERVIGQPFFLSIGVCMNNFMVAQRFEDEDVIDATFDYVLTFRMRPTPVKLRLLKQPAISRRYILIQR